MTTPGGIDDYLATLPDDQARCLQDLRSRVKALLPEAEEVISYAMPGHRIGKKMIAGYAGFSKHCGFYPHSGGVVPMFGGELEARGFKYSKSGVLFTPDKPIPDDLLERLIAARLAEAGLA
jgi:uncharacterized protein YdhG (YjbR/CyaY superfamily)